MELVIYFTHGKITYNFEDCTEKITMDGKIIFKVDNINEGDLVEIRKEKNIVGTVVGVDTVNRYVKVLSREIDNRWFPLSDVRKIYKNRDNISR